MQKSYELMDKELNIACKDNTTYVNDLSMILWRYSKYIK